MALMNHILSFFNPFILSFFHPPVVPGRVELPTSTLSVWRSNQLSYRTGGDSAAGFSVRYR